MEINTEQNMEQLILEVAENLFLEKGFAMTTTTEIARVAGCNQALVHYYYRTKERLFDKIFEKKAKMFFTSFMQTNEENIPFEEKLKKSIEAHFNILIENPKFPFLLFNELTTNPKRLNSIKQTLGSIPLEIIGKIQNEFQNEIKKGNIRPMNMVDFILTIASLNVFLFVAKPIISGIFGMSEEDYIEFLELRKQENIRIILNSLKP